MIPNNPNLIALVLGMSLLIQSAGYACQPAIQDAGVSQRDYYRATLAAAEKAIRLNEISDARFWLDASKASLHGWEWKFLNGQLDESAKKASTSTAVIRDIQTSPDGKLIATCDANGGIQLLDPDGLQIIRDIGNHAQAVYSVAFSPDNRFLCSVSRDQSSRVWDVETGAEISKISLDNPGVAAAVFSPDGKSVATCTWLMEGEPRSVHGVVWIWNAQTGEIVHRSLVGVKPLDSIVWSADGQTIVVGSWDGLAHILDSTGQEKSVLRMPDEGIYNAVISVALDPAGKLLVTGSKDRTARVWDLSNGELVQTLRNHEGFVNSTVFSPDGRMLATGCEDAVVRLWDLTMPRALPVLLRGHLRSVDGLAWSADGQRLISAARDQTIRQWNANGSFGGKLDIDTAEEGTYACAFSPDGSRIVVATHGGHAISYDSVSGKQLDDFVAHQDSTCNFLSIDKMGDRMLTCSWDKTAKLWQFNDKKLLHTLDAGAGVYHCSLSPDGNTAALCVRSVIQLWNATTGEKIGELTGHASGVRQVCWSRNSMFLATASEDSSVGIWDVAAMKPVHMLKSHEGEAQAVSFSPNGQRLASGDTRGNVIVWDATNGQLLHKIQTGDRSIYRLAWSPDSERIAAGSAGITLLDSDSDQPLLQIYPLPDTVWYLEFSPDGNRLAACSTGGKIVICNSQR